MDNTAQLNQAMGILHVMLPLIFGFIVVGCTLIIVPYWQIFKKAGFPPALGFLMIIPLVNLVVLYVLAFSQWKVVPVPDTYYVPPTPAYPPSASPQA